MAAPSRVAQARVAAHTRRFKPGLELPVALVLGPIVAAWSWATIALIGWLLARLYPTSRTVTL